jgi:hypothetical protein
MERRLQGERDKARTLGGRVQQLEADARATQDHVQLLTTREKEIVEKSREQIQNQQQTITLLVSEKASLTASLDRLEELELRMCAQFIFNNYGSHFVWQRRARRRISFKMNGISLRIWISRCNRWKRSFGRQQRDTENRYVLNMYMGLNNIKFSCAVL